MRVCIYRAGIYVQSGIPGGFPIDGRYKDSFYSFRASLSQYAPQKRLDGPHLLDKLLGIYLACSDGILDEGLLVWEALGPGTMLDRSNEVVYVDVDAFEGLASPMSLAWLTGWAAWRDGSASYQPCGTS